MVLTRFNRAVSAWHGPMRDGVAKRNSPLWRRRARAPWRQRGSGLVRAHEPKDPDDSVPVSRANQAAAFDRVSRSSRSCLPRGAAGSTRHVPLRLDLGSILSSAFVTVGLGNPVADRLPGGLELASKVLGITSGTNQIHHLAPELRRYGGLASGHLWESFRVSTNPGQSQRMLGLPARTIACAT